MIDRLQPSKSEIISLGHSLSIGVDCIMLSEETATSVNFLNTIKWLKNYSIKQLQSLESKKYNFPVFANSFTSKQGVGIMLPYGVNQLINCGGVLIKPGDLILGDNDGVVVLPKIIANEVLSIALEREEIEKTIKIQLEKNPDSPGKYYPFNDDTYKLYEEFKKTKK